MELTPNNVKSETKKRSHHPERVTLSEANLVKVDHWMSAVQTEMRGSRFNRSDMINWIIERAAAELSQAELKLLRDRYFDPSKALEWALEEIKKAQKLGQKIDANEILRDIILPKERQARIRKPRHEGAFVEKNINKESSNSEKDFTV